MGRFEQVWAGEREPRLRAVASTVSSADEDPAIAAYCAWSAQLMAGADAALTPRALDLRKLRLTEGYREALRQAPRQQAALFAVWDTAYRVLERLHWQLAPPVIDPPPPPTFDDARRQYKALKRERERQAEAQTTHWHPLEIQRDHMDTTPDDPTE